MIAPGSGEMLPEVVLRDRHGRWGMSCRLDWTRGDGGISRIYHGADLLPALCCHKIDLALHVLKIDPERVCGEEIGFSGGNMRDVHLVVTFKRF